MFRVYFIAKRVENKNKNSFLNLIASKDNSLIKSHLT